MRLINTTTYKLEEHLKPGPYAILSHTWREHEEVLYDEFLKGGGKDKKGFRKIEFLCSEARASDIHLAWIDTACIDKSSSAELSEAINSMFRWYQKATVCYVYLDDTDDVTGIPNSRWITRGWTLQELLAPRTVLFYNQAWMFLGSKISLLGELENWTGISQPALENPKKIKYVSAATRMRWASRRETTRIEDVAYCLLGIFDVNLPLLYGEGEKAFLRLQTEIIRQHQDGSLLIHHREVGAARPAKLLASSPAKFDSTSEILQVEANTDIEIMDQGISIRARLYRGQGAGIANATVLALPYRYKFDHSHIIGLGVACIYNQRTETSYFVSDPKPAIIPWADLTNEPLQEVTLVYSVHGVFTWRTSNLAHRTYCLQADRLLSDRFQVIYEEPLEITRSWSQDTMTSEFHFGSARCFIQKFIFVNAARNQAFAIKIMTGFVNDISFVFSCTSVKPAAGRCAPWVESERVPGKAPGVSWILEQRWFVSRSTENVKMVWEQAEWELVFLSANYWYRPKRSMHSTNFQLVGQSPVDVSTVVVTFSLKSEMVQYMEINVEPLI